MGEWHSIWLMPAKDDLVDLQAIVRRLAAGLGSPVFCPHLTLVEDMQRSASDLADVLVTGFADQAAFVSSITAVDGLPLFFRSLYAGFEPTGELLALKQLAIAQFSRGDIETYMPHISLAYGATEDTRAPLLDDLRRELVGRSIRFDAIAVVNSAQSVPIEDWTIVHRLQLR